MSNRNAVDAFALELLQFSLEQENVQRDRYYIGEHNLKSFSEETTYLLESSSGDWTVGFCERGQLRQKARHDSLMTAAADFFNRLTLYNSFWKNRAAFESLNSSGFDT